MVGVIKRFNHVLMALFVLLGVALGLRSFGLGVIGRGIGGVLSAVFLLIPAAVGRIAKGHPELFYCGLYLFLILAYDIGFVGRGFDNIPYLDKVSHFISGFVFTMLGYGLYLLQNKRNPSYHRKQWLQGVSYAVFFSCFVAVAWEIAEFCGFVWFGHDSQHTLTTGVFDTMHDLVACFSASVLCAGSVTLWLKKNVVLVSGAVARELVYMFSRGNPIAKNYYSIRRDSSRQRKSV